MNHKKTKWVIKSNFLSVFFDTYILNTIGVFLVIEEFLFIDLLLKKQPGQ